MERRGVLYCIPAVGACWSACWVEEKQLLLHGVAGGLHSGRSLLSWVVSGLP